MFLANGLTHVSPEQPDRVSTQINSTFRYVPLMQGSGFTPAASRQEGVFLSTLPRSGHCATGGCGDAHSPKPCSGDQCGRAPVAVPLVTSDPRLAFSSTDCTVKGEQCGSWLSFHNCNPSTSVEYEDVCK